VTAAYPTNIFGAVLSGLDAWGNGPAMPSFATSLSDQDVADIANYVRTAWGNTGVPNAAPADVKALRAVAMVPASADAAADALACPRISATGVNDPGNGLLDIYQGATPETVPSRTSALIAAIRQGNASISDADLTDTLVAAYCPVVAHADGLSAAQKRAALAAFIATLPALEAAH